MEAYDIKEIEQIEAKNLVRVFRHKYACAYIGLCMQASCMHTHTSSLRMYAERMHTQTRLKP